MHAPQYVKLPVFSSGLLPKSSNTSILLKAKTTKEYYYFQKKHQTEWKGM
jgi:hypothetical protein